MSSAAVMPFSITEPSPRFTARMTGFFWLMTIVMGSMAMFVDGRLALRSDAAVAAANILGQQSFYRLGITANLVSTLCYLAATLFIYDLLKPVNRTLSLLAAFFSLAGCVVSSVGFVLQLGPVAVVGAFPADQLVDMTRMFLRLSVQAANVAFVFFGLHCFLVGRLSFSSRFLPRIIGMLMIAAGLGWLTFAFANLLSPPFARSLAPWIMLPGIVGEVSLTLWLLVKGVDVQEWKQWTA